MQVLSLPSKDTTMMVNKYDNKLLVKFMATCFGCKQPSSGQRRTTFRYMDSVHSMGSNIVYNSGTLKPFVGYM